MGGVDLLVQMVDHVAAERAFHKFWKVFFLPYLTELHTVHMSFTSKTLRPQENLLAYHLCVHS